ncbi:MAG: hypothetical protein ACXWJS_01700, partial [Hyphomicrobium sp.]
MADASSPDGWALVLAGLIGFASAVGANWINQWWQTRAEKDRRREEKFEALMGALYEHRDWLKALGNSRAFGSTRPTGGSPMARVRAIVANHFPMFREQVKKLDAAADHYELWTFPAGQERAIVLGRGVVSGGLAHAILYNLFGGGHFLGHDRL